MPHKRSKIGKQKQIKRLNVHSEKLVEKDTIRSIIRNLSPKDNESGEITFTHSNILAIKEAFKTEECCAKEIKIIPQLYSKHVTVKEEPYWFNINPVTASNILDNLEIGEVLNCGLSPCWWR